MNFLMSEWRQAYDFVVLDCPPVLPVTDTQYLESMADATFLIARAGTTTKIALRRSYQLLLRHAKNQQNPKVGVVLNFISVRSAAYYGYYGYSPDPEEKNVVSSHRTEARGSLCSKMPSQLVSCPGNCIEIGRRKRGFPGV